MLAIAPTQGHNRPGGLDGFQGQADDLRGSVAFFLLMTGPIPLPKDLWQPTWALLPGCALSPSSAWRQLFVARGGWGESLSGPNDEMPQVKI